MDGRAVFIVPPAARTTTTWACSRSERRAPGAAGLDRAYHLAWEVPTIEDLATAAAALSRPGRARGMSDHGVSKSLYGRDPDGNEFEIMWRVPREAWGDDEPRGVDPAARSRSRARPLGPGGRWPHLTRSSPGLHRRPARAPAFEVHPGPSPPPIGPRCPGIGLPLGPPFRSVRPSSRRTARSRFVHVRRCLVHGHPLCSASPTRFPRPRPSRPRPAPWPGSIGPGPSSPVPSRPASRWSMSSSGPSPAPRTWGIPVPSPAPSPRSARVVDEIGDRQRVVILGPDAMRVELEREYVTINRDPHRLVDVEYAPALDRRDLLGRLARLTAV